MRLSTLACIRTSCPAPATAHPCWSIFSRSLPALRSTPSTLLVHSHFHTFCPTLQVYLVQNPAHAKAALQELRASMQVRGGGAVSGSRVGAAGLQELWSAIAISSLLIKPSPLGSPTPVTIQRRLSPHTQILARFLRCLYSPAGPCGGH